MRRRYKNLALPVLMSDKLQFVVTFTTSFLIPLKRGYHQRDKLKFVGHSFRQLLNDVYGRRRCITPRQLSNGFLHRVNRLRLFRELNNFLC
jgi:hypothetical protein